MPFCEHTVAAGLPQGRYIASKRVRCRIVDILTGQVLEEEQRHGDAVTSVHFTAHGELVSSSGDRCIHLWKVPTAPPPSSNPPKASLRPPQLSLPPHPVRVSGGTPQAVVPAVAGHAGRGLSLRLSSTCSVSTDGSSPQGNPPPFSFHPDFLQKCNGQVKPPTINLEACNSEESLADEMASAPTPVQRVLTELATPQAQRKAPTPSARAGGGLSVSQVFRIKDQEGVAPDHGVPRRTSQEIKDQHRRRRQDQAWTDQQLSMLDKFQQDLEVCSALQST